MVKNLLSFTVMASMALGLSVGASSQKHVTMSNDAKLTRLEINDKAQKSIVLKKASRVVESKKLSKNVISQVVEFENGVRMKRLVNAASPKALSKKAILANAKADETTSSIYSLNEDFEGADGTTTWMPEGWSAESKGGEFTDLDGLPTNWYVCSYDGYSPEPNGTYYACVLYDSSNTKDEWLVSPVVTATEFPTISYQEFIMPLYLFNLNEVDWDNYEFTKKECSANLQILVKADDEENWTVVKDYYDEYKDWTFDELMQDMYSMAYSLKKTTISLEGYAGKNVQIAFRYFGLDGNTVYIDDVKLSNPELEVSYLYPLETLFFGVSKDSMVLPYSVAMEPVNAPLYWTNLSELDNATFSWQYSDPDNADYVTTNTTDLEVTYHPDYSSEFTCRNNWFYPPILTASAPGAADGVISYYDYFQCGGKAEYKDEAADYSTTANESIINLGLMTFDYQTEGMDIATAEDANGNYLPVYGYADGVDEFWTEYTFNGQEEEGEGVKMTGILNYYFTSVKPIVIKDVWVHGKGIIGNEAEFTLDIIPMDDEGVPSAPIATAKCKGSDMTMEEIGTKNYYMIPFTFNEAVVLDINVCSAFIIRMSGFNDPANVTYFAPYQSVSDNPNMLALGWLEKEITMGGETRTSLSPLAYYSGYQSFAIVADGIYPWLDCNDTSVSISSEGVQEVSLGSYYDGSELNVSELPEWLNVEVTGRYGDCKATFTASGETAGECEVVISAPGVSQTIKVNYDGTAAGIEGINTDKNASVEGVYTVSGQRIDCCNATPGVYVVRYSNGRAEKRIIK